MTNLEYLIQNPEKLEVVLSSSLACKGGVIHTCARIYHDTEIKQVSCQRCDFSADCVKERNKWLHKEYNENKISKRDFSWLSLFKREYWIVRNSHGNLMALKYKPDTNDGYCLVRDNQTVDGEKYLLSHLGGLELKCVHTGDEPITVADLLKLQVMEEEETEERECDI